MKRSWGRFLASLLAAFIFLGILASAGLYASIRIWPQIGAQAADGLRQLVGDEAVARLETLALDALDFLHVEQYKVTGIQPEPPWTPQPAPPSSVSSSPLKGPYPAPASPAAASPTAQPDDSTALKASLPTVSGSPASPALSAWNLAAVPPLGKLQGEGQWSPFINDLAGQVVAYRTFFQPDPKRPFSVVAVVAMDLGRTRLHFVLGSKEPASPQSIDRSGQIPDADLKPGILLAAFNGGFKANQGQFGAMVYGLTVLPPRPGLGVVAMYSNGQVRIGAWGTEITSSPQLVTWRQNGPLIIQAGEINPRTSDFDPQTWGYAVRGSTATWRSGVGISADNRSLFYAAGPDLTLPALAASLQAAGAYQALQLDINDYWVHFDAFQATGLTLQPICLLDEMKTMDDRRYLKGFIRDFFYLTAVSSP